MHDPSLLENRCADAGRLLCSKAIGRLGDGSVWIQACILRSKPFLDGFMMISVDSFQQLETFGAKGVFQAFQAVLTSSQLLRRNETTSD